MAGYFALVDRRGQIVGRYSSQYVAKWRALLLIDARIVWIPSARV